MGPGSGLNPRAGGVARRLRPKKKKDKILLILTLTLDTYISSLTLTLTLRGAEHLRNTYLQNLLRTLSGRLTRHHGPPEHYDTKLRDRGLERVVQLLGPGPQLIDAPVQAFPRVLGLGLAALQLGRADGVDARRLDFVQSTDIPAARARGRGGAAAADDVRARRGLAVPPLSFGVPFVFFFGGVGRDDVHEGASSRPGAEGASPLRAGTDGRRIAPKHNARVGRGAAEADGAQGTRARRRGPRPETTARRRRIARRSKNAGRRAAGSAPAR